MFCADSPGIQTGRRVELRTATSTRYVPNLIADLENVRVCSRDTKFLSTKLTTSKETNGISILLLRSIVSTEFKSEQEWVRSPKQSFGRWIEIRFDCTFVKQCRQPARPFSLGQVSLLVVHPTVARKTFSAQCVSSCESIPFAGSCSQLQKNHNIGSVAMLSTSPLHCFQTFATCPAAVAHP